MTTQSLKFLGSQIYYRQNEKNKWEEKFVKLTAKGSYPISIKDFYE